MPTEASDDQDSHNVRSIVFIVSRRRLTGVPVLDDFSHGDAEAVVDDDDLAARDQTVIVRVLKVLQRLILRQVPYPPAPTHMRCTALPTS